MIIIADVKMYDVQEVATMFNVHVQTVRKWIHKGSKQKNSLDLRQRIGYNVIVVNRYSQQRKKQSEVATLQTAPRKTFNFCVDFYKKVKNTSFTILL